MLHLFCFSSEMCPVLDNYLFICSKVCMLSLQWSRYYSSWKWVLDKIEGSNWVSHTYCCIQPHILSVSPPVVAVTGGTTIIQPSVVKTESDVMRTVKEPWLSCDTVQQSGCHAEAGREPHTSTQGHANRGRQLHATACYSNYETTGSFELNRQKVNMAKSDDSAVSKWVFSATQ